MSAPTVSSTPITLVGVSAATTGSYSIAVGDMVVLRFAATSSGNATPFVYIIVSWGDGTSYTSDLVAVGTTQTFQHSYAQGQYQITVTARNTDGLVSALSSNVVLPVNVTPSPKQNIATRHKWAGPALPISSIGEAVQSVSQLAPTTDTTLAMSASEGSQVIFVANAPQMFVNGAVVIISEPGKLFTTARVISSTGNQIQLDSALNDNYDTTANVEVRSVSILQSTYQISSKPPHNWYIPTSYDNDLIKAAIRITVAQRPQERVMRRNLGCDIYKLPFEPNDLISRELARTAITEAMAEEPRATVTGITLTSDDENGVTGVVSVVIPDAAASFDVGVALSTA